MRLVGVVVGLKVSPVWQVTVSACKRSRVGMLSLGEAGADVGDAGTDIAE